MTQPLDDNDKEFQSWLRDCGVIDEQGVFNQQQALLELHDFHFMLQEVPKVYMHITNGKLSKPNYYAHVLISEFEEHVENLISEIDQCIHCNKHPYKDDEDIKNGT